MESRMAIQVIDNFLEKDEFNKLSDNIMGDSFPWYYNDGITNSDDKNNFYLTHIFYRQPGIKSNWFNMWLSTIEKLKCKSIIRIKKLENKRVEDYKGGYQINYVNTSHSLLQVM